MIHPDNLMRIKVAPTATSLVVVGFGFVRSIHPFKSK